MTQQPALREILARWLHPVARWLYPNTFAAAGIWQNCRCRILPKSPRDGWKFGWHQEQRHDARVMEGGEGE